VDQIAFLDNVFLICHCNALFSYLIILVEFRVFYMTYMIYVDL